MSNDNKFDCYIAHKSRRFSSIMAVLRASVPLGPTPHYNQSDLSLHYQSVLIQFKKRTADYP